MNTTDLRLSASTINSIRQNSDVSDGDFCFVGGARLIVKMGYDNGEFETRTFRSLDGTHWKENTNSCLDIWHSQQMSSWLSCAGRGDGQRLVGLAVEDEKGGVILRIGNPYA